jgi:TonB family protein
MLALALAATLVFDPGPGLIPTSAAGPRPVAASEGAPAGRTLAAVAVTLECTARANGRVENCQVLGETHPGLGFGEAAVALMRDARVDPGPRDIQFARTIQFVP